ncbi:DegV family protein [Geomicrobium sp. JCM 19038]|nr:DegV family protein [Geomicrobium sp. JCM 19038]
MEKWGPNMSKIAIVTDSTAYLDQETIEQYQIKVLPLSVNFGEETIEETNLGYEKFYDKMRSFPDLPTTSQPALGHFIETYEQLARDHDAILSFHLSSGISGTFQTAVSAARSIEHAKVYPFDSEISCEPQAFFIREAAQMIEDGKDVDEIFKRLSEVRETLQAYFIVDDLNHLHRGGRLSGAQRLIGSALKIKPILTFENKVIVPYEKVRTYKRALQRVLSFLDQSASEGKQINASVIHANALPEAERIQKEIQEKYDNVTVSISYFGPVIGTHLGENSIGVTWYESN